MTKEETMQELQQIIDENQRPLLVRVHIGLLIHALKYLKEQEGYVSVPFSWLVKFCSHIDFNEPMPDSEREQAWKEKLKQQFGIDV